MMPLRLTRPTVGLIPAKPFEDDGQTMEPSVSVPMAAAQRFAETPAPEPELEPQGLRSSAYGFLVRPPRPLHPLVEWLERIFAHSLRLVLPRMTAPALRSFCATNESCGGIDVVFDQHRDSVHWSARAFGLALLIESGGDGKSVGIEFEDAVDGGAAL